MLSSIRCVNRIPRYFRDVLEKKLRFISTRGVEKRSTEGQGLFKILPHNWHPFKRTFCATEPETEFDDVNLSYANIITSPDVEKQIKMILLECELAKQCSLRAPSSISEDDMKELLQLRTLHSRRKYFHYLRTKELDIIGDQKRKEKKQLAYQMKLEEQTKLLELTGHLRYGLNANIFFMYIRKTAVSNFYVSRLCRAAKFEQPLVFDFDFDDEMSRREMKNAAEQLRDSYGYNRRSTEPFDICFCNMRPESQVMPALQKNIPNVNSSSSMITLEERSYLDLYPKEKLVYLSPDASENLKEFDGDKIYIVGVIVDKRNEKPLTLAKAKREGIKTARLPLDKYLLWGIGHKSLTINQVMLILLEWKKTNDWNKALCFVPTRKLKRAEDFAKEQEQKIEKLQKFKQKKMAPAQIKRFPRNVQSLFNED